MCALALARARQTLTHTKEEKIERTAKEVGLLKTSDLRRLRKIQKIHVLSSFDLIYLVFVLYSVYLSVLSVFGF